MNDYELDSLPFYVSEDGCVKLFKGCCKSRQHLPIVAKCHEVHRLDGTLDFQIKLNSVINVGLAQARVEHQHSCKILEIRIDFDFKNDVFCVVTTASTRTLLQ